MWLGNVFRKQCTQRVSLFDGEPGEAEVGRKNWWWIPAKDEEREDGT